MRLINKLSIAYIGSIVPDEPSFVNKAFSRAGNMCQLSLLKGLIKAELSPDKIFSLRPVVSFPGSSQLFCQPASAKLENNICLDFLPFINITPIKQLSLGIAVLLYLLRWCRKSKRSSQQRVICTFNISVPPGIFTLLGARLTGSKAVAMIYDICVPGETAPDNFFTRIDYWLHKKTLPLFDGLVVITDAIAKDFAPNVPSLRIEGGISNELISQYQSLAVTTSSNKNLFSIVAAGRLDEINGINELLDAFAMIMDTRFRLHIAGTGPLEKVVKVAAGKDSRITFHGFLAFDEVLKLYSSADLLVNMRLTQRINTRYFFPSKTMEYLASGVPVITTCPGNVAEEYSNFAYLLHDESPAALAAMMVSVAGISEEKRKERGHTAQCYMAEHKTWDAQAEKIAHFINSIACKHKGS